MIYTIIDIKELIPIEKIIRVYSLQDCLRLGLEEENIPVIPFDGRYITCDAHHRTLARLLRGVNKRAVAILERNEDVKLVQTGVFAPGEYRTIERVKYAYKKHWKPELEKDGINSFYDYLHIYAKEIFELNDAMRHPEF